MNHKTHRDSAYLGTFVNRFNVWTIIKTGTTGLILVGAIGIASTWMSTPARPSKQIKPELARLVEVTPIKFGQAAPMLQLHGEVMAATSVTLKSQVEGTITSIYRDLAPGTLVSKGQVLAEIDSSDYVLGVTMAEAGLADATASYQQELGDQAVAAREMDILLTQLKTELTPQQRKLILREPQLAQAQASVDSAQGSLDSARLALTRTKIKAPFSGTISAKHVDQGSQVTSSTETVELVDTEAFWIQVALPIDYLTHLTFADQSRTAGSTAKVHVSNSNGGIRSAELYRRLPELDSATRQAQVLLRVYDPLALDPENHGKAQLMVNDYVAIEIEGDTLDHVVVLDESYVHNGDQVWTNEDGVLRIHTLDVIWREQGRVIAAEGTEEGIANDDLLITTNIASAYDGLPLRTVAQAADGSAEKKKNVGIALQDKPTEHRSNPEKTPPSSVNQQRSSTGAS